VITMVVARGYDDLVVARSVRRQMLRPRTPKQTMIPSATAMGTGHAFEGWVMSV